MNIEPGSDWPPQTSDMSELIRARDWAQSSLGPMEEWSIAMRIAVSAALDSPLPSIIMWGRELVQIYNDAYRPLLGLRHPAALGQRTAECWPEVHHFNAPLYEHIFDTGQGVYFEDQEYVIKPFGIPEPHWFTISYGPIRDAMSTVCGILVTAIETTQHICAERESAAFLKSTRNRVDQLHQMFDKAPSFMAFLTGPDHTFEMINDAYRQLMKDRDILGKSMAEVIPEDEKEVLKQLDDAYQSGKPFVTSDIPVFLKNSAQSLPTLRYLNFVHQPIKDVSGKVTGIFVEGTDVTEKARADSAIADAHQYLIERIMIEEALFLEKTRADVTLNSISDAVIGTDVSGNVNYLNAAAEHITGWSRDEARGRPINDIMPLANGTTLLPERNPVEFVLKRIESGGLSADTILLSRDGSRIAIENSTSPICDSKGRIRGAVIVFHDITAVQAMADKMTHLVQHDFLTNLPNRVLLNERIEQAFITTKRDDTQLAVLVLDLDNFKHINDTLGRVIGNKLLKSVAQRLCNCVRQTDMVSRECGNQFVILLADFNDVEDIAITARKIIIALAMPHSVGGYEVYVTTNIGISVYPGDAQSAEALIKTADIARYYAKEKGRNNFQFFKNDMNVRALERQAIETGLRHALERNELVLHYQPKVNLNTGLITGAEALVRWIHPDLGMIFPGRFVPIAEECSLIIPIGRWVLHQACLQAQSWKENGLSPVSVAVNISALEFKSRDFVEEVRNILNATGLSPHSLQLEITESILMTNTEASISVLHQLKQMGIQLAIDDFGTGYSSLSYLQQFPVDILKIDQSFVQSISALKDNGIIVSAVIAMGSNLNQRVIAEGIEDQEQMDFLKEQNCEEGQGYLFSEPLAPEEFALLLATGIVSGTT